MALQPRLPVAQHGATQRRIGESVSGTTPSTCNGGYADRHRLAEIPASGSGHEIGKAGIAGISYFLNS